MMPERCESLLCAQCCTHCQASVAVQPVCCVVAVQEHSAVVTGDALLCDLEDTCHMMSHPKSTQLGAVHTHK